MKNRIKNLLFVLPVLLMLMPLVQQFFNIPRIKPLKGSYSVPVKPKWNWRNFLNSTFQDSMNVYLEHHIGYRPDLVRLYNQFRYTIFDTVVAQGVIIGKEGYLFEHNYIKALYGLDYVGDQTLANDIQQAAFVADWLQKQNKHLIVFLAPGKASYFPEFVPDKFKPETIGIRNVDAYYDQLKAHNISVINGNKWFTALKDSARFALYPKCGIHWSYYGVGLALDSLISTMAQLRAEPWLEFGMTNIEVSSKLRSPDRDLWEGMNIFSRPNDYPMPYPDFYFQKIANATPPNVIVVADSYYWQLFGSGYAQRSFGNNSFWYYNQQVIAGDGSGDVDRSHVDILLRVMETDFIVLMQTDATLPRFSFGFVGELYEAINRENSYTKQELEEIQDIISRIRANDAYMEMIHEKAVQRNISTEEMLRLDALWVFEHEKEKRKNGSQ